MYFYKNLYTGPSIRDPEEVKRKLMRGEGQFTIYVIALSPSIPGPGSNQLEILHGANLQQHKKKKYPPFIIGIAAGRTEAVELVQRLVQEAYDYTGSGDVRAYLFPHGVRKLSGRTAALTVSDESSQPSGESAPMTRDELPQQPQSE